MNMEREAREEPALRWLAMDLLVKWAQPVMPQAPARRVRYEQCNRASDRREQDKAQDAAGLQKRRWNNASKPGAL